MSVAAERPPRSPVSALAALESVPLGERDLPVSTYDLLVRSARRYGDRPALHLLPGGRGWRLPETWTYEHLLHRVNQAANLYWSLGVRPGEVVGLMLPNTGATYAALLGAQTIGIANPVNPMLATEHIVDILELTGAQVLVAPAPELDAALWDKACEIAAALPGIRAVITVGGEGDGALDRNVGDFDRCCGGQPGDHLVFDHRPGPSDLAAYFHTGGTTGTPKVAPHTHANEVYVAWAIAETEVFRGDTVVLAGLPLFHVNAVHVTTLAPFLRGQSAVGLGRLGYRDREAMADFWRIVEHYRVTTFSAVPTVYSSLPPVPDDVDISSLRSGFVGAAPLPERVRTDFESATGVRMVEGYGLTEATCATAVAPMAGNRAGAIGLRLPYQQVKAVRVDEDGSPAADCPPGEPGVLAIKGPSVFPGYLTVGSDGPVPDPAGSIVDGWLITGDVGRVDADGFVYLTGRAKDIIIRGGHNIDPRTVEESLLAHPDVTAAAVVPRPDAHAGEVPVAYVVLRPDAEVSAEDLLAWAGDRAPEPAAAPKSLYAILELPVTAVGKVYKVPLVHDSVRRLLAGELLAAGLEGEVTVDDRHGRPSAHIRLAGSRSAEGPAVFADRMAAYPLPYTLEDRRLG